MRIRQEIVLGMSGVELLKVLMVIRLSSLVLQMKLIVALILGTSPYLKIL